MSFKDTFTKEDSKASLLEYDDGAFYYFASTCLVTGLLPCTIYYIRKLLFSMERCQKTLPTGEKIVYCGCSLCAAKRDQQQKSETAKGLWRTRLWTNRYQLLALAAGWILLIYLCATSLTAMKSMATFDPFDALGISPDATERQIKKAFRTMSLKYHPDKNRNDPAGAAKFLLISKAYHTLTDEKAKKNFEKYGNPDGPGMMKVGIGLPSWMIDEKIQTLILFVSLLVLLVVIPAGFILYYNKIRKYAPSGLRIDTVRYLSSFIKDTSKPPQILVMVASSTECRMIPYRPGDAAMIESLEKELEISPDFMRHVPNHRAARKAVILLIVHMKRKTALLNEELKSDLKQILRHSLPITKILLDISVYNNWIPTLHAVMDFRRTMLQAAEVHLAIPFFLQIPHLQIPDIQKIAQMAQKKQMKSLHEICDAIVANRQDVLPRATEGQLLDIKAFAKGVPRWKISINIAVEDETIICVGDVATLTIDVVRENLEPGEAQGPVHAPFYPDTQYEEWFIFAADAQFGAVGFQQKKTMERQFKVEMQFPIRHPGKRQIVVKCLCDSYIGVDVNQMTSYVAEADAEKYRKVEIHAEDAALDNEPTLLQTMIGTLGEASEGDDEDGDDDNTDEGKDNDAE